MADNLVRLLAQMQGWAALLEANHEDAMRWIADERNGHPKAQDFEPTGHGGSNPVEAACLDMSDEKGRMIRPDRAAQDLKDYERFIRAAWRNLDNAVKISNRHQTAVRPKRQPDDDLSDVWCVLHLQLDYYEPIYRKGLCRPCTERKYQLGDFPTLADVTYHKAHGRWPRKLVDPKNPKVEPMRQPAPKTEHKARLERLQYGTEAIPDPSKGAA